jgi:EmrB/QacA subfamily drug resistance transporter
MLQATFRTIATEPRRPRWVRERPAAWRWALATVCIGAFMGQLDASIVTVAVPTIQHDLHAPLGAVAWVGLAYLVTLVSTVAVFGRLSDMVGRKLVYLYGFLVFVAGSAACAFAPSLDVLIVCRVIQGLGAAMLQANSVAIIALAVPRRRLGRAIGVQGAAQALGLAAGPTVGGLLLALGGWRALFLVNVPAGLVAFGLGWALLPRSTELRPRRRLDLTGLGLLVPGIAGVLCALTLGPAGDVGAVGAVALAVAAAMLLVGFVRHERRAAAPLLDLDLLGSRTVAVGVLGAGVSYAVLFGVLLAVPFFLERGLGLGVAAAGAVLATMPVALGVTATLAGRLAERVESRRLTVAGMALAAAGLVLLAIVHADALAVAAALAVVGVGLGCFTPANNAAVMRAAPREAAGEASGLLNMGRGLGTAVGLALTSLLLSLTGTGTDGTTLAGVATVLAVVALGGTLLARAGADSRALAPAR